MYLLTQGLFLVIGIYYANAAYYSIPPASDAQNAQSDVQAPAYVPPYLKNQRFGSSHYSGTKTSYRGTKTSYSGTKTGYAGTKTGYAGTKTGYAGTKSGYGERHWSSHHSWSSGSGSAPSYQEFHSNANEIYTGKCNPDCKNNGICVDVNTCQCQSNFYGKFCEFEKKPCLTYPPLPMNSRRQCPSSELCTITCAEGHKFFDGSTVANMRCAEGQWQPTRADFTVIPDCEPECEPPCLNGGVCLAVNMCQCPMDYRGPQCQYAVSACDASKLSFNGGYKCFGDGDKFNCRLSCPPGAGFSSRPAELYTCLYSKGIYEPQPIPHCVFPDVVIITPSNRHNISYYDSESSTEVKHVMEGSETKDLVSQSHSSGGGMYPQSKKPLRIVVQDFTPRGGTCFTWAGVHYKTFDDKIYSFQSPCQHILVRDAKEHKYTVAIKQGDCKSQTYCPTELTVYLDEKSYVLGVGEDGAVVFRSTKRLLPMPASLPGIRVSMPSDYVLVNLDAAGIAIKWDINNVILVEGSVLVWNNTEGLCGTLDGNPENEFKTKEGGLAKTKTALASSWQINKIGDLCDSSPSETSACASKSDEDMKNALAFCTKVFSNNKFRKCSKVMDVSLLLEACQWDYCACMTSQSHEECACSTVSVYAKECLRHGVHEMSNWRDADTCPMKCPDGKVYQSCGPDSQPSCASPLASSAVNNASCVEGCFCPEGLLLEGGKCLPKNDCPCRLRNKNFPPGTILPKDCNTCTCEAGSWVCSKVACGARCSAVGDPHYATFDGARYDFMGHCTYHLLLTDTLDVQVENVACSGAITEALNLAPSKESGKPSCTKAVTINYGGATIQLKQGGFILVNGKEISSLPVVIGDIRIRAASSLFLIVQLPIKVDVWWDGNTRIFVDVPPEFQGQTKGLCGTFNLNQKDDFLTPEGDVEQSTMAFANKWKTREFCSDVDTKEPEHPCKANMENKEAAEKYCSKLKSTLFESCHWHLDVESYYAACVYDMCACAGDVGRCLCPVLGDYAMACAAAGQLVQWRYHVPECELSCTGGQEYTVCADSCLRKCSDTSLSTSCKPSCVEGCACPTGQLLDDNGVCVPVGQCPCYHKGLQFNSGYKEVRAGKRERELCTCVGARWQCSPATEDQIQNYPPAEDIRNNCSAANNMEFTTCELMEPLTCKNMHLPALSSPAECRPGCQCKKGFVLDMVAKKCVRGSECPCHHGGRSYSDGHIMKEECNTCECKSGNWSCTKRKCSGECSAWGDSHITTFDGTDYDFEGVCTYLLAKGVLDGTNGFEVEIQNVPCGTTGATCSKSVTLRASGETVSLTKHAPLPDISNLNKIKLRLAGAYVFLDVPTLGMSLQWDRGMRVYVKVDSMWLGRVKGLCGNYNGDMRDDFQTPTGGGLAEASPLIFADSWKLKSTCPKPSPVIDHCKQRPERKDWAGSVCGAMKRYPFSRCHSEVAVSAFVERCTRDACACDAGDDCACACAALAAYAHACAHRGLAFKWRRPDLCPMQCDEECSNYNECVSACPLETCDNTIYYSDMKNNCEQDTCVEGCKPKKSCPEGEVYSNSSLSACVPRAKCRPVCMTLPDGREVLEGEVIEEDACHTCRCTKKERVCSGQPCSTVPPQLGSSDLTTEKPHDEPLKCMTGWTSWVNRGPPEIGSNGESIDNEPLPKPHDLRIGTPMCKENMMTKVECRTVGDHKTPKETGLDVECSLERGLLCREVGNTCPDFEIRVYCECEEPNQCVNSIHPNEPHPTDCTKFYECSPDGAVVKSCGPGTMYNPVLMVCDWPASVAAVRPECRGTTTGFLKEITPVPVKVTEATTVGPLCPVGQVYSKCAYPCDKLCDHFKKTLQDKGMCLIGQKCFEGCIDQSVANIKCEFGSMWRDERTCVPLKDCTCYHDGKLIKPGGPIAEGCLKCQCLDNKVHCDSSECVSVVSPIPGSTHESIIVPTIFPQVYATKRIRTTSTTQTPTPTTEEAQVTIKSTVEEIYPPISSTVGVPVTPIIIKNTATPPPECSPDDYIDLMWGDEPLPDSAFTASSVVNALFEPQFAVLDGHPLDITAGSWNPRADDKNPYIQVELPRREPIYGVKMQGSPVLDQYVTSYQVMYGDDGNVFSTVDGLDGKPKTFRGPVDHDKVMKQMFEPPIEAKFVRILPMTWHDEVSLRYELIGCRKPEERGTTRTTIAWKEPECTEPLGLAAQLPLDNIKVSSNEEGRRYFVLQDGERGWRPLYSTPGEWIMFNFTSPRNLTGIKTRGGSKGWVTAYNVMYTSDLATFNPVYDQSGSLEIFPGNVDQYSVVMNEFKPPIRAQYLKILPTKWKDNIEMQVEPIGCFEPYPVTEVLPEIKEELTTTPVTVTCETCPGVPQTTCDCSPPDNFFDGENCVTRDQCPCVEGFMTYPVGSTFRGPNCDECVCKLGGLTMCSPVKECKCAEDLVPKLSSSPSCECVCEPCANGTKICPTSKLCLAVDKWCDGLQDCPDDERDCTTTTTEGPTAGTTERPTVTEMKIVVTIAPTVAVVPTTVPTPKPTECPVVEKACPRGYEARTVSSAPSGYSHSASGDLPPPRPRYSYQRYYKGGNAKGGRGYTKTGYSKGGFPKGGYGLPPPRQPSQVFTLDKPAVVSKEQVKQVECPMIKCIPKLPPPFKPGGGARQPTECSVSSCPPGYTLKLKSVPIGLNQCPEYECIPPPERPSYCNVTGRTINTFDGSEYKYDLCYHMLARENRFNAWIVLLRKKCSEKGCSNELLLYQDDQVILVKPNMMINYNNYEYTVEQTAKICFQKNSFDVNRLGNGIFIKSRKYNFTVLYTSDGDVKIGVLKKHKGSVDGMCGPFDDNPHNDRRLPSGMLASNIEEFGRSWAKPHLPPDACQPRVIPPQHQKKCWDMCNVITEEPFAQCSQVLNLNKWRSICLEKVCECSDREVNGTKKSEEECRCLLLEQLVAECLAANKDLELSQWRVIMDCPAECPPPLVHSDCYRRACEPTCADASSSRSCPVQAGQCFPGCYCPEGKLRQGDQCIAPTDCLDCTCKGVGSPAKYVTFEGDDLPFLTNCTYLASRDVNSTGQHKYQVYATNGPCEEDKAFKCTKIVSVIYENKVIKISKDNATDKLVTLVDGVPVFKYPMKQKYLIVSLVNGQDVTVLLQDIHVELTVLKAKLEFNLRVPSYLYANATQGLCGVCAGYMPLLTTSDGLATDDFELYRDSWQAKPAELKSLGLDDDESTCEESQECVPPAEEDNPCYNLYNADKFGACHALVDPTSYVESCSKEICGTNSSACGALETYVAECARHDVCLPDWRQGLCPYPCETPLVYRACVKCERTCDNHDQLTRNPDKCTAQPVEGCFCPEGKVRANNTCIEPAKCFPCDEEHYVGDEWQESACKKCSCSKTEGTNTTLVSCTSQQCSMPVCGLGEDMIAKTKSPSQCCTEYMCVPKPEDKKCEEPKKMECGFGQVLKQKTTSDGCKEFACECKPKEECEKLPSENDVELQEPGMEMLKDDSGCCPRIQMVCKPETCPSPPSCDQFTTLKTANVTGKCCPEHTCELPKDKCVVKLEWEAASRGGEKARNTPQMALKDLDSAWLDGPCRSCRCESSGGTPSPRCSVTECPAVTSTDQFVVEARPVPFSCCPVPLPVACRDGDNVYKVGENWTSPENVCESYRCVETEGGKLERLTTVQQCPEKCQPGWKYFPAAASSGECCGKCEPVACVVGGEERPVGDTWMSADLCTNYTCVSVNGSLQVESSDESCSEPSIAMKKKYVLEEVSVPGVCCVEHKPVACRVDNKIYQEGQSWPTSDPCVNVTCSRDESGVLTQKEHVETCVKECKRGWKYHEPPEGTCCGHCLQDKCLVDDELKEPGTKWQSADNCTTYSCERTGDEVFVMAARETCPDVTHCPPERRVNDSCCITCTPVSLDLSKCVPKAIPSAETIGTVRVHLGKHGLCVNTEPIHGLNECRGNCDSGTIYNNQTGGHESSCTCCAALRYASLVTALRCADGSLQRHAVGAPAACACQPCGAATYIQPPGHKGTKSGYHHEPEFNIPEIYHRFGSGSTPGR